MIHMIHLAMNMFDIDWSYHYRIDGLDGLDGYGWSTCGKIAMIHWYS